MTNRLLPLVGGAVAATLATPAFSQLEEIVVTAQRREQSLQDVPISVMAITGDSIRTGGFSDMEDMSAFVPNLWMRDSFTGQVLAVRGIGTTAGNEAFESAVAIFHDDVYYGRDNLGQNAFFDLERVEILRGPQPLFFGQSATAGALNVTSRTPGDALESSIRLSYGDDEESNFEFGIGGPVTDTFGLRFATRLYELGTNHYYNPVTGRDQTTRDNSASRLLGTWEPSETVRVRLKYERQDVSQEGTGREFVRCDTDPQYSTANTAITSGFSALCALDALAGVIDLDNLDGATGNQGMIDIYERVAELNAASGAQFGDANYVPDGSYELGAHITPDGRRAGLPFGDAVPGSPAWQSKYGANGYTLSPLGHGPGERPFGAIRRNLDEVYEMGQVEERYFVSDVATIRVDWDLSDSITLTSTTSFLDYDKHDWLDPDGSTMAVFTDERIETFEQSSQEIRLQSDTEQNFSWMAGVYWQESDLDSTLNVFLGSLLGALPTWRGMTPEQRADLAASSYGVQLLQTSEWQSLFFAGNWNVSDVFSVNVGGRYQDTTKTGRQLGRDAYLTTTGTRFGERTIFQEIDQRIDFDDFLPEFGVQWDFTDAAMFYAKYSEAFKMGGFVVAPPIGGSVDQSIYFPEEAEGVEVGIKSTFADGSVEFNVAYFDTDYTNLQTSVFLVDDNNPQGVFVTANAGGANSSGFEFDGRWAITDNFRLGFSGSLGDAQYTDYPAAECNSRQDKEWRLDPTTSGPCRQSLTGVALPNFPDWTLGLSPTWSFAMGSGWSATLSGNIFFSDGYELAATPTLDPLNFIDSWQRVDLNLTMGPTDANWELGFYARDLTDERVWISAGASSFQHRTRRVDHDAGVVTAERGRRVGVQFNYFFGT